MQEYFPVATKHPRTTSIAVPTRVDMFSLLPTVIFMDTFNCGQEYGGTAGGWAWMRQHYCACAVAVEICQLAK